MQTLGNACTRIISGPVHMCGFCLKTQKFFFFIVFLFLSVFRPQVSDENATFWKRSPELRFLKTPFWGYVRTPENTAFCVCRCPYVVFLESCVFNKLRFHRERVVARAKRKNKTSGRVKTVKKRYVLTEKFWNVFLFLAFTNENGNVWWRGLSVCIGSCPCACACIVIVNQALRSLVIMDTKSQCPFLREMTVNNR